MISIIGKSCTACKNKIYPVRSFCPACKKTTFEDWLVPTEGTIFSFTKVNFPLNKYENPPYYVGLISMDPSNKPLLTVRIINKADREIKINQKVHIELKNYKESGQKRILTATLI